MNAFRRFVFFILLVHTCLHPARAATFIVDDIGDSGPGSLRQAILDSNQLAGTNTIIFTFSGPHQITQYTGEFLVTNNVNIVGIGDNDLLLYSFKEQSRLFHTVNANVTLTGMTIANGSNYLGGGILQEGGSLTLSNCTIMANAAINGGGIAQTNGTLRLTDCTVSSNSVVGNGMGIYVQGAGASTVLRHSTLAGNTGTGFSSAGGGIAHGGSSMILDSCTFYGNGSTAGDGGGVLNTAADARITNCTFYGNHSFFGGGVASEGGTVTIRNSIIAGNTSFINSASTSPDCHGTIISGGFNLIGNRTNSTGWISSDQLGTGANPINPMLGPLKSNGGLTWTAEPLLGSPAIDKGHSSGATNDQRGYIRPFDKSNVPNAAGGDGADIGAFETGTRTNLVTNVNSSGAGSLRQAILDAGIEDITTINFQPGIVGNTIGFGGQMILDRDIIINGPGALVMSITPDYGQRVFQVDSHKTVIYGLTFRDGLVFGEDAASGAAGGNERGGAILNSGDLSLFDCVISNNIVQGGAGGDMNGGFAGNGGIGRGGGIANFGTLALTRCTLATNSALGGLGGLSDNPDNDGYGGDALGGGLYSEGSVHLTNCTVYANRAIGGSSPVGNGNTTGGGICNYANNPLDLATCTVANNIAFSGSGGGIYDAGSSGVYRNSTIALNQSGSGGGLHASGCNIGNCIIAANNNGGTGPDIQGGFNSSDYNLIQAGNGWFTTGGSITYTIVGLNPLLGPLQNNGGPTLTMALLPGSPAIDHGTNFGITLDQCGRARPFDLPEIANVLGGDGTDIGAFELVIPLLHIARSGNNALLSWSTNDTGFQLQASTNVSSGVFWSDVPGMPSISGTQFLVIDPLILKRFYRLRGQ